MHNNLLNIIMSKIKVSAINEAVREEEGLRSVKLTDEEKEEALRAVSLQ